MDNFIKKNELLKLAAISKLELDESQIESILQQLNDVLSYSIRVQEIAKNVELEKVQNSNLFRADEVVLANSEIILSRAPETDDSYFVVPKILEK